MHKHYYIPLAKIEVPNLFQKCIKTYICDEILWRKELRNYTHDKSNIWVGQIKTLTKMQSKSKELDIPKWSPQIEFWKGQPNLSSAWVDYAHRKKKGQDTVTRLN